MHWFENANYDFIGKRYIALVISGIMVTIGIISLLLGPRLSIDFKGGIVMKIGFKKQVSIEEFRSTLSDKFSGAEIQRIISSSEESEYTTQYTVRFLGSETENAKKDMSAALEKFGDYKIFYTNIVGPKVGSELKQAATISVLLSLLSIIAYLWWRMDLKYGIAGVIALFHDVLCVLGVFYLLKPFTSLEISLSVVAALLTIVGYSINDTIVVFSRIIEYLPKRSDFSSSVISIDRIAEIMNKGVNSTLSRTINTALTTLLVVIVLLIFGGETIRDFAAALLIGIFFGTYSSIFVATPIVFFWDQAVAKKRRIAAEGSRQIEKPASPVLEREAKIAEGELDETEEEMQEESTDEGTSKKISQQKKKKRKGRN
ncbi:MAG: protein translocase subunit SecF [Candidatus Coatesbacteria bacterium]|nr:protein translocase subunit SecF [Candidatus Coatesbacteria bacterium]